MLTHHLDHLRPTARVVLIGSFGATNAGDELILAGFLKEFRKKMPRAAITVLSGNPAETSKRHGVTVVAMLPTGIRSTLRGQGGSAWRAMRQADAIIFPGGGLFTDEESLRSVVTWSAHLLAAAYLGRPVYLFGQSIGPFRTSIGTKLATFALTRATHIVTRDDASIDELIALGIPQKNITRGHDAALWLDTPKKIKRLKKQKLRILVSVRDYPHLPKGFWQRYTHLLDALIERHAAEVTFVPWETGAHDDRRVWTRLRAAAWHRTKWHADTLPTAPTEVLAYVRGYDLVIGMRLHSLIVAHLAGVPTIGITYSRKVAAFQTEVGQPIITPDEIVGGQMWKRVMGELLG